MKTLAALLLSALTLLSPAQEPDKRFVVVPLTDLTGAPPKPVPLFFSATATVTATIGLESTTTQQVLDFTIHQGKPETLTLALTGTGEIESLTGEALKDWSVRIGTDGTRFLDIRPAFDPEQPPATVSVTVKTRAKAGKEPAALLLPAPAAATGFALKVDLSGESGAALRITRADGLVPLDSTEKQLRRFLGYGAATLEVAAIPGGYAIPDLELTGSRLQGQLSGDGNSVTFKLFTTARARAEKVSTEIAARVALAGPASGDGWHVVLREGGYDLVATRAGEIPVELGFVAPVKRRGDWRVLDFNLPAGVVVPVVLTGVGGDVLFDASQTVVPEREGDTWRGFLPAGGTAGLAWRSTSAVADGALFYSSSEATDVRIGSGLMRQTSRLGFRILQGKLGSVSIRLDGPGEILGVDGVNVLGWKVVPGENGARTLAVTLNKPFENRTSAATAGAGSLIIHRATYAAGDQSADVTRRVRELVSDNQLRLTVDYQLLRSDPSPGWIKNLTVDYTLDGVRATAVAPDNQVLEITRAPSSGKSTAAGDDFLTIRTQTALGNFPVRSGMLRLTPEGTVRHSGFIRVANEGAVRLDVTDASGLIQLAPGQFPGPPEKGARQLFVYRFPSADYTCSIQADQVLPEVGVTEVTVYELAETDRRVTADLELDIREAPLREWEIGIPADHAVASVTGAQVADYAVGTEVIDGRKRLKILFKQAVANRQLVSVRLEKSEAAAAGPWELQPLAFPGAKSRRGYVGAIAAAGYRLQAAASNMSGVAEVPVTFFPKKTAGLQQAFRLREGDWKIGLAVEALGQSVQADVFHLYSLKAGSAYGSVLINYFVVGAPATEWRIAVPESIGNIEVTGQNVGLDWRREGNTVIVPLSRAIVGAGTVLLTFEQPMNARGGTLSPGEVRPLEVQAERGYVQVVSPLQVKFSKPASAGALLAIDASELPTEYRLLSSAPTLAAWQYTARDFNIGMNIEWFEPGETVAQAIDFLKLSSKVSRDGEWVTDATFFVKSRAGSGLRTVLPQGAVLWEARVNGQPVNARDDGSATLIRWPLRSDPNDAVEVSLRYGARGSSAKNVSLAAPVLDAPVVVGEWTVTGDEGRQLVPRGGTAEPLRPVMVKSGWQWLSSHPQPVVVLMLLGVAGMVLAAMRSAVARHAALVAGLAFIALAAWTGLRAFSDGGWSSAPLEYVVPVMAAGKAVELQIANLAPWQVRAGWGTWLLLLAAAAVFVRGAWASDRLWIGAGLSLAGAALLSILGGAPLFFGLMVLVGLLVWGSLAVRLFRGRKLPVAAPAVATVVFLTWFASLESRAAEANPLKPAESMVHDWRISGGRLRGTLDVALQAEAGDRFLLLRDPVVLGGFEGEGLRVIKEPYGDGEAYFLIAEAAGKLTGRAVFEMPLASPEKPWALPSGPAASRQVTIRWNEPGWEFISDGAASTARPDGLTEQESGTVMVMVPSDAILIHARPRQRDASTEETRFFAEVSNLFLPGPGVVNGRHRVSIRPAQGRVSSVVMRVPDGFTVSDVVEGPVGAWRFDPEKRELRVPLDPAQDQAFAFTVESQRGAGALPMDLDLSPLRVDAAAGEVGFLALAFGNEAQPESIRVENMSRVNAEDFTEKLLPRDADGNPLVLVQNAFRYGAGEAAAHVRVAPVAAELRAEAWQLVSLGEDRLTVTSDLSVTITRSGVFRLALEIPEELELETATGEGLSHWTEARVDGKRVVTLHLAARTMGKRVFQLVLTGRPPGTVTNWQVPRLSLREASRETGVVIIVPERGLQVGTGVKKYVSQLDASELSDAPADSARAAVRPGALVYRMLQGDWSLGLSISRLDPWVTARVFHDATLREGQVLTRVGINYRIENAAIKSLRVRIPGLDPTAAATVRATGPAVGDLLPVQDQPGLWEIQFQRGVAGETRVELEYQRAGNDTGTERIEPVLLEGIRGSFSYYVAVRAGGRLELEAPALPRGWSRSDWSVVQSSVGPTAGNVAPLMAFRVAEPEGPLPVTIKRHQLAGQQKLRVVDGTLTTLLSAEGESLTAVDLRMQVAEKGTLHLRLPAGSQLFNVQVNEEGSTLVREGDEWLFHVFPSPDSGRPASVRFVYSASTGKQTRLEGPVLDVPMENLTWRVLVPEGWRLVGKGGDFEMKRQSLSGTFRLEDYQSFTRSKKERDSKTAVALLDQANRWLSAGDQEKASMALSNATRSNQLDAASGEDARVQLRELKTQQAVLGLNTRRQKMQMDNKSGADSDNIGLERAAELNPVMRGRYNFDPKQFDRFLEGNTADENAALKEIASRIVTQQLAAEPAPVALDVNLPERGTVVTFARSVQTDGTKPMSITLDLKRASTGSYWLAIPLCLLLGALAVIRQRHAVG
ncbi:MAG: hypothetical protein EOP88_04115 [Verrucomicrobiaceae bacterium]|nr:MAG: hypothetical protein EOP88_04115 [Verrucomicrobiaceae bacterium]